MSDYFVPARSFYDRSIGYTATRYSAFAKNACAYARQPPMEGIVKRYSISDKHVLSLGTGEAFEEYNLYNAGCPLTLLDINPDIERAVSLMAPATFEPSPDVIPWIFEKGERCVRIRPGAALPEGEHAPS